MSAMQQVGHSHASGRISLFLPSLLFEVPALGFPLHGPDCTHRCFFALVSIQVRNSQAERHSMEGFQDETGQGRLDIATRVRRVGCSYRSMGEINITGQVALRNVASAAQHGGCGYSHHVVAAGEPLPSRPSRLFLSSITA